MNRYHRVHVNDWIDQNRIVRRFHLNIQLDGLDRTKWQINDIVNDEVDSAFHGQWMEATIREP